MKIFRKCRWPARVFRSRPPGSSQRGGELFQVVVTPVYVQSRKRLRAARRSGGGLRRRRARRGALKEETGGSDFVFVTGGRVVTASASCRRRRAKIAPALLAKQTGPTDDYLSLATPLLRCRRRSPSASCSFCARLKPRGRASRRCAAKSSRCGCRQ